MTEEELQECWARFVNPELVRHLNRANDAVARVKALCDADPIWVEVAGTFVNAVWKEDLRAALKGDEK